MARRATKLDEDASYSSTDLTMSAGVHTRNDEKVVSHLCATVAQPSGCGSRLL